MGIPPGEEEHSKEADKSFTQVSSSGCLPSGQLSGFLFHTQPTLGPSPGVRVYPSAEIDLEVKASGRSKTHCGLELSPGF